MKLTTILLAGFVLIPALSGIQEAVRAQEPASPEVKGLPLALVAGDEVEVRMYDLPDVGSAPIRVHVAADGTVQLPYAGTIHAGGMSPDEFQSAVADALKTRGIVKYPNVTVNVVSALNMMVHVLGEVKVPRSIPIYSAVPISYVLGQVGGITGLASHHLTIIHHSEEPPTTLDYDPDAPTAATVHTMVQPGDIVSVSHLGVYFVAGEVYRVGVFPLGGALTVGQASSQAGGVGVVNNMTLLQALAQAGGVTAIAARSKMHILRTEDGKRIDIVVDQVKLSKGEVADPILHPNDIIYVPSSYLRLQTNNLFSTAINALYAGIQLNTAANR